MLNKTKTLTTIARQKTAKEKVTKWTKLERSPMKTTLRRTEPYKWLQRTKPLRRTVLIEEGLAKSSKKQHSENTDKWHLCKAGSFSYGESPRTTPLEGTSLHRWNNNVERPWGILSLFTTCLPVIQSPCHRLWHVAYARKSSQNKASHTKCEKGQNHSQEDLGRRKHNTWLKKEHSEQIK